MRTTSRLVTAAVAVAAMVLPGSAAVAAPEAVRPGSISWTPCAEDPTAECGTLSVPIDWAKPNGPKVDLALARRKATDPSARIGSLIINPGGPGGSGVDFALFGPDYFSPEIRRHFDLVGFDPRGVARSHPVLCSLDLFADQPSFVLTSQADFDRVVAFNRRLGEDCRRNTGPLFDHVDTLSVVRDIDAIRAAVGDRKLSYYGVSYGTLMGQQYAETFPQRVRALALDSNMDHSLGTAGFLFTEAGTAQDSFNEFVKGCSADSRCALFGRNIRAFWNNLLARAARGELRDPFVPGRVLTEADLIDAAFGSFFGPAWFSLAEYLVVVDAQEPPATAAGTRAQAPELVENSFQAVFCEDWRLPMRNFGEYLALLRVQNLIAPNMRYSPLALSAAVGCLGWPAQVNNPQHALRVRGAPRLLLVNALHDPATGYIWALNAAAQLGDAARLVTYEGWGHGTYGRGDCPTGIMDAYLVSGTLPRPGTRCPAVPPEAQALTAQLKGGLPMPNGPRPAIPGWG
jgi:pimeloyl-ACP methyl ester carboxylesterase